MRDLLPFLMFCREHAGQAEEAITFYCSVLPDARVVSIDRYGPGEHEPEGHVRTAVFEVVGKQVMAIDSSAPHQFTFTPAISLWVECSSRDEIDALAAALGEGGQALMPLDDYGFSPRFTWIADRYGVTWQLNLAR